MLNGNVHFAMFILLIITEKKHFTKTIKEEALPRHILNKQKICIHKENFTNLKVSPRHFHKYLLHSDSHQHVFTVILTRFCTSIYNSDLFDVSTIHFNK